jgi:3-oxoadipate enol-lactonase/4-carboxymuconolactone decarboxylase
LPFLNVDSTRLFYRLEGRKDLPVLILSHSLGCDHDMWAPQMPDLLQHFRVVRFDTRGHGASDVPHGDYKLEEFGRDVLALADALQIEKFAWCGLSMGGAIGQWLALHAPERLTSLVLANTAAKFGTAEMWEARRKAAMEGGMAALVDLTMQRFFSPDMLAAGDPYAQSERAVFLGMDPAGYLGCCAALRDVNHLSVLGKIRVPTLVIGSDADPSTPWAEAGSVLARDIPGAKSVVLPGAHLSNLARPRSFTAAVLEFLIAHAHAHNDAAKDPLEEGLRVRRQVLGSEHVDRSMALATDLTRDFQLLISRYAWGAVWNRPGLDHRTRRLLVMAITAAMSRWEEFRLHLRAALRHGMEPCDIRETLLQAAIYAGVPAANTGLHIATEEIEKLGVEKQKISS